jgi:Tfp pilus assembly ATPase PilU
MYVISSTEVGQNGDIKNSKQIISKCSQFKGMAVINQNLFEEEIKRRLSSISYHSVQSLVYSGQ